MKMFEKGLECGTKQMVSLNDSQFRLRLENPAPMQYLHRLCQENYIEKKLYHIFVDLDGSLHRARWRAIRWAMESNRMGTKNSGSA